ncbi:MATE family efflux transporter [Intestinibacter sp.]|uniref:MATE family efflux transporter n=1 Tax=Intestinibacter sp. TaxID=1965304 RepID=UPI002A918F6B|nr:MATE family efflux transporter [Intestinibacter sp.]MDY5211082.1 MATE family efflux transporter [Intestinibacter sp.]
MGNYMTEGNAAKSIAYFSIPLVLSSVFQQLYNLVDSIIVGNYIGEDALAAVGASYSITMVFMSIAIGSGIGCAVVIAQYYGAKMIYKMKTSIYTSIIAISILSVFLGCIGWLISDFLLEIMKTPANIFDDALKYLKIYFLGLTFMFLYNIITSIFNALGESKIPLYFLIFSSFLNILLDLIFVVKLNYGVVGVAVATLIAQGISAFLSTAYLFLNLKKFREKININNGDNNDTKDIGLFNFSIFKNMSKIAIPSIFQQSFVYISIFLVQIVVNTFGSSIIAGYTIASKIDSITMIPLASFGNAVGTFTAQNIGAKKINRVKEGLKSSLIMIALTSLAIFSVLFILGKDIIDLFLDENNSKDAIGFAIKYLRIVSAFYIVKGFMNAYCGVLKGAGDIGVFVLATMMNFLIRLILVYVFSNSIGESIVYYAVPIGWVIGFLIGYIRYKSGRWKLKSIIK